MTSDRRFEQELPGLLDQLAYGPHPDYRDHIVQRTARERQRPAWMFPERWLNLTPVTSRVAVAPRVPWRWMALAALLLIGVTAAGLLLAASRPKVPAPFGRATNGLVTFAADGDIYTVDRATGKATAIVAGADFDTEPVWSRDGTRLVFQRQGSADADGRLVVVDADGSRPTVITPSPLAILDTLAFSPDGNDVAFLVAGDVGEQLWLAATDGSSVRRLDVGKDVFGPKFLAPAGTEMALAVPGDRGSTLYAVNTATGAMRTIVEPTADIQIDWVAPAPDGSRIAYTTSSELIGDNDFVVHVVNVDGSGDRVLPMPADAVWQGSPVWSNDGTRIALMRGFSGGDEAIALAAVPADGSGTGVDTMRSVTGCCDPSYEWAPDDSSILVLPSNRSGLAIRQYLWDPASGVLAATPWLANSNPSWQRKVR